MLQCCVYLVPGVLDGSAKLGLVRGSLKPDWKQIEEETKSLKELLVVAVGVGDADENFVCVGEKAEEQGLEHGKVEMKVGCLVVAGDLLDLGCGRGIKTDIGAECPERALLGETQMWKWRLELTCSWSGVV